MNANNMATAENLINEMTNPEECRVKYIKKDRGLLERKDYEEKIILSEDNRQVLLG